MHVIALSSLRTAARPHLTRSACRVIAGSRIPPYKVSRRRSFGTSIARRKAATSGSEGVGSSEGREDGETPAAESDKHAQEKEIVEEDVKRNGNGRGGRVIVGGRSRVRGARERTGLPSLELSEKFFKECVVIDGDERGVIKLRKIPQGALKKEDATKSEGVEAGEAVKTAADDVTVSVNAEDSVLDATDKTAPRIIGGIKDKFWDIDEIVYEEALNRVRTALLLPPPISASQTSRPVPWLHCPQEGGDGFLSTVMANIAEELNADLIIIDADDIAESLSDYLGENIAWRDSPVAQIAYDIHQTFWDINGSSSEGVQPGPASISKILMGVMGPSKRSPDEDEDEPVSGSSDKKVSLNSIFNLSTPQNSNSEPDQWTTLKLNAGLEMLLSGADEKWKKKKSDQENQGSDNTDSTAPSKRRLIIQIQEYEAIKSTEAGAKLIEKLHKIVDKKWRDGREILLIGSSSHIRSRSTSISKTGEPGPWRGMPARVPEAIHVPAHESGHSLNELFRLHKLVFNLDKNVRHVDNMVKSMLSGSKPKVPVLIDKELEEVMELRKEARKQKQDELEVKIPTTNSLHKFGIQEVVMELFRTGFQHRIFTKVEVQNLARKVVGKALETGADRVGARELFDGVKAVRALDTFKYDLPPLEDDQTIMRRVAFGDPSQQIPHMSEGTVDRFAALRHTWSRQEEKLSSGIVAARDIKTTFADIRAPEDTVEALKTLTSLSLLRPEAFSYGVLATDKIPGLLLYGPPGTGKTLLAKAVAKESGATVLDVSGADLNDMYVGEGEKNVKALFSLAKKLSPCIVFIDEADAIFAARGGQSGSQRAHRDLINQFLREWDGMKDMGTFIMIATNRPFDLDDAVLRRLPRRLLVDLPVEKDREAILGIHLKGENLAEDVSIADIAKDTPLYSGSDLKNVCVAAALACIRDENAEAAKWTGEGKYEYPTKRTLKKEHFKKALDEISASVSEDMSTLAQIRKFDERYGDRKGRRKKKSSFGFGKGEDGVRESEEGRVRTALL